MGITKEEFKAYEKCRRSGVTNMMDVKKVEQYTGLTEDKIYTVMEYYKELSMKYFDREEFKNDDN